MVRRSFRPLFIFMILFVAFATANARQMKAKSDSHRKTVAVSSASVPSDSSHKLQKITRTDAVPAHTPVVLKLPGVLSRRKEAKELKKHPLCYDTSNGARYYTSNSGRYYSTNTDTFSHITSERFQTSISSLRQPDGCRNQRL